MPAATTLKPGSALPAPWISKAINSPSSSFRSKILPTSSARASKSWAIYDTLEAHTLEQIERGRLVLVEVDGFYLPDTQGTSYKNEHTKTTIGINRLDPSAGRMDYFHNDGFFSLSDEDYQGILRKGPGFAAQPDVLFPYVEFVKFDRQGSERAGACRSRPRASSQTSGTPATPKPGRRLSRPPRRTGASRSATRALLLPPLCLQHVASARRQFRTSRQPSHLACRAGRRRIGRQDRRLRKTLGRRQILSVPACPRLQPQALRQSRKPDRTTRRPLRRSCRRPSRAVSELIKVSLPEFTVSCRHCQPNGSGFVRLRWARNDVPRYEYDFRNLV